MDSGLYRGSPDMTLIILWNTYLFTNTRGTSLCRIYKYDTVRCLSVEQTKPIVFVSYSQKCTRDFHREKIFLPRKQVFVLHINYLHYRLKQKCKSSKSSLSIRRSNNFHYRITARLLISYNGVSNVTPFLEVASRVFSCIHALNISGHQRAMRCF